MMRVLILGGTGLLGVNFCYKARNKAKILCWNNKRNFKMKGVKVIKDNLNIKNLKNIIDKHEINLVCNFIGLTSVDNCQKFKKKAKKTNFLIPKMIAEICKKKKYIFNTYFN